MPATKKLAVALLNDTAQHTLATVPSNTTWIIKSIAFFDLSGNNNQVEVSIQNASPIFSMGLALPTVPPSSPAYWSGWVVLTAGDIIYAVAQFSPARVWISGSQLQGIAS